MITEKRRLKRKAFLTSLEFYSKDDKKSLGKGYITDITEHGLGVISDNRLPVGEELLLDFTIPNGWKFDLFGKVVHARDGVQSQAYGIEFSPGQGTFVFKLI